MRFNGKPSCRLYGQDQRKKAAHVARSVSTIKVTVSAQPDCARTTVCVPTFHRSGAGRRTGRTTTNSCGLAPARPTESSGCSHVDSIEAHLHGGDSRKRFIIQCLLLEVAFLACCHCDDAVDARVQHHEQLARRSLSAGEAWGTPHSLAFQLDDVHLGGEGR